MSTEKTTPAEGELSPLPDVFPDFAISLEESQRRIKMLQEFVRDQMVENEDYGVIPGTGTKPTLFKPGAEKLNAIFGLAPIVEITNRVEDWENSFVGYEVKVTLLNKRSGQVEAEGIGSCNSRERRYKNQDAANVANTLLKMAKKRALVDATLSATRASGLFTQDLEDVEIEREQREQREQRESRHEAGGTGDGAAERRFVPASSVARSEPSGAPTGHNLTEAQRGAILSMAKKAFGPTSPDELAKMAGKPVDLLTKSEASALIDRLRSLLVEQQLPRDNRHVSRADTDARNNGVLTR